MRKKTHRDIGDYELSSLLPGLLQSIPDWSPCFPPSLCSVCLGHHRQNDPVEIWVRRVPPAHTLPVASHLIQSKSRNSSVFNKVFMPGSSLCPHQSFSCFLESVSLASWHPPFPPTLGSSHWPLSHPECSSLTLPSWLLPSHAFLKKHLLSKSSLTTLSKITVPLAPYLSPFLLYIFPL